MKVTSLTLLFAGALFGCNLHADKPRVLHADIVIVMKCAASPGSVSARAERFLTAKGFSVLDLAAIRKQRGAGSEPVRMYGLREKAFVELVSVSSDGQRVAIRLNTHPPTRHESELEAELHRFAVDIAKCEVTDSNRSENPASVEDLFQSEVDRIKGLFDEANRMKGGGKA